MPNQRIGFLGGGQLAKMMAQSAQQLGFSVWVLDPDPLCPAHFVADNHIVAGFGDENGIRELASHCNICTYDLEHIDTNVISKLQAEGFSFAPSPEILSTIQDKGVQKEFLASRGIPMPKFQRYSHYQREAILAFGLPCVQKTCKGGYDGRGVLVLQTEKDLDNCFQHNFLLEEMVNIEKELGIIVARDKKGNIVSYPVTEMVFDPAANICDMILVPARIPEHIAREAQEIAISCVEAFQGVGVFGVELFLDTHGKVLYNEMAPRPHNSGHYTIEACITSQFEQHIRCITGLPMGAPDLRSPAIMFNLLGEVGYEGKPVIEGLEEALSLPGLSFHFYRKAITKPYRKMGHVTIIAPTVEEALQKALSIKPKIHIRSEVV
jgi:5-(carboxyamino)imidazole ribonucleotide synthase